MRAQVKGIWPEGADGTDINDCERSHDGELLATSDDYGLVKLFKYPVWKKHAEHRSYNGHSSHVRSTHPLIPPSLLHHTSISIAAA
jgi:hypothetical protein